jgi:hypothetical protein
MYRLECRSSYFVILLKLRRVGDVYSVQMCTPVECYLIVMETCAWRMSSFNESECLIRVDSVLLGLLKTQLAGQLEEDSRQQRDNT